MRYLFRVTLLIVCMAALWIPLHITAQSTCPTGYFQTTLGKENTPNLFRLGLKHGVSWTRIILPSGGHPVPERIFADTAVCVPSGGTSGHITTPTPAAHVTPTPTHTPGAASAVDAYCRKLPIHGIPDRGSCMLEAEAITSGRQRIVESNIACTPHEPGYRNGVATQCSIFGNAWLSAYPVPTLTPSPTPR